MTAEPKEAPKQAPVTDGKVNTKTAAEAAGLTELRLKTLAREGKVPSAQKDERGFWRYDSKAVTEWAANRPKRAGSADGRRTYKVRLNADEAKMVQGAIKDAGLELKPLNPPKQKGADKAAPEVKAATPKTPQASK